MVVAMSSVFVLGLVILVLAYILWFYIPRLRLYKESAKFPGPPNLPFIGSAHYFIGSTEDILNKSKSLMETYPSPFRVWLGGMLYYVVYEPEQIKTICVSPKTLEKDDMYKFVRPWLGTGLLTAPISKWKIHRKLIMPTFNSRVLESFVEVISAQSEILIKQMEKEVNGDEFEMFRYTSLCTLDIICETAMGVPLKTQTQRHSAYVEAANKLFELIYTRVFYIWLHPDFIFNHTKGGKEMQKYLKYVHGFTDDVIKKKKLALVAKENSKNANETSSPGEVKRKAFLDLLMELSHEGNKLTDEQLREEVDTMMIAGNDTTATVISFAMLMLAYHPEVQDKVYEELCKIYGSEDPCATPVKNEDLQEMEYLERVIKETMRLFPVGPMIARKVTEDLNIGEFTLTKGSSVILGLIRTHRSEEYWKDPMTFDPDRFLPEECAKRHPYTFIPFSAGPRNCLGIRYAMMAMKIMIATVVRKYVIKKDNIVPIPDIKVKADAMLKPVDPIKVRIERRIHGIERLD